MKNILWPLYPTSPVPSMRGKDDLLVRREQILQAMLITFAVLGVPSVFLASLNAAREGSLLLPALYGIVYIVFAISMVFRQLPYTLRANVMTSTAYLLAVSELFESGQIGEVRMFLIAFVALTAVLFAYKNVIFALLLSVATIAGAGIVSSTAGEAGFYQGTEWVTASTVFLMLGVIVAGSITLIISRLEKSLSEQAELTKNLSTERDALEQRVAERTSLISRRLTQLRTAADITHAISILSDPRDLLNNVVELIKERFELYYVGAFLLDETRQNAVLVAGTGEAGKRMLALKHHLAVGGSSMIGWSISNRQPRIALDVGTEAVRFSNPNLPLTRSELALPIITKDRVLGAITVQSENQGAFDENDIAILESITESLAVALDNDRLFQEVSQRLEEIRSLNHTYIQKAWYETLEATGKLAYEYENSQAPADQMETRTLQVPLLLRDEVIGSMVLEMDRPGLSDEELTFVEHVTTQTAIALENARLLHETEQKAVLEQRLNEMTSRFSRSISVDEILRAAIQEFGQLPSVAEVSVSLNPTGNDLNEKPANGNGRQNGKDRTL